MAALDVDGLADAASLPGSASAADAMEPRAEPQPGEAGGPIWSDDGTVREPAVLLAVSDVLDLLGAAVLAGADIPRALRAVGEVVGGPTGAALSQAASALVWGASWGTAWAPAPTGLRTALSGLEASWTAGTAAAPVLRAAADAERRRRRRAGREAAARLGVRVVLPLGLCFLPAFVLLGLVPVLVSLAGRALG